MIFSTSNSQAQRVINLRDKAKARREEGLYVAEGLRMCREYKPDDVEILYITENFGKQEENKNEKSSPRKKSSSNYYVFFFFCLHSSL